MGGSGGGGCEWGHISRSVSGQRSSQRRSLGQGSLVAMPPLESLDGIGQSMQSLRQLLESGLPAVVSLGALRWGCWAGTISLP